jgi:hypothetical protein
VVAEGPDAPLLRGCQGGARDAALPCRVFLPTFPNGVFGLSQLAVTICSTRAIWKCEGPLAPTFGEGVSRGRPPDGR